ncbi:MAG TPA: hypothetical protein VMF13_20610 [Luteitalea sp.]|nr:hypothetical protein [Luteitalea sp.]
MARDPRQQRLVLGGLLGLLLIVSWWQFGGSARPSGASTGTPRRPPTGPASKAAGPTANIDEVLARGVGLTRLDEDRPAPEEGGRDPFRSGPAAVGPDQPSGNQTTTQPPTASVPAPPPLPPQPVGPPPIVVKFIGVVSRQDVGKVAVLSDGKNVYYGRAGEIVDGRWRIVSIGEESLQIEYADGRGRQTVRLTG